MWRGSSFAVRTEGLIGFAPHAVGISEDTWAVSQAAHNLIGLGRRVKYRVSEAIWHKIRETGVIPNGWLPSLAGRADTCR
jgi:hypothetical protein